MKPEPILFADSARGIFIPYHFATTIDRSCVTGLEPADWIILSAGPEHDLYDDVWTGVLESAVINGRDGHQYHLYHDQDLWLVPLGMEWNEEADWFAWPDHGCGCNPD